MQATQVLQPEPTPASPLIQPNTLSELGVPRNLLQDLAVKILYMHGEMSTLDLANEMRVSLGIAEEIFQYLRREQLCEVTGMIGNVHRVVINSQGRSRALQLLEVSQYTGPAPVSLEIYVSQVREQSIQHVDLHPPEVEQGLAHLVLDRLTLAQIGPAINSGRAIFLYGPTGTGKTALAEAVAKLLSQQLVWIPYAVEVDGQIITVYDPVLHQRVPTVPPGSDQRWVQCERPTVVVGGELSIEMLDLQFNAVSKFYTAPVQMKANNGLLLVDDLGRQRLRPEELLNRWVVPLDRRIEFLTLAGGKKIEIPFELMVVFATNLNPAALADAAFLRRIQTKIKMDPVSAEQFHEIFRRVCAAQELQYDSAIVDYVIAFIKDKLNEPLRPCYPRDVVNQVCWAARYEGHPARLDHDTIRRALSAYFVT